MPTELVELTDMPRAMFAPRLYCPPPQMFFGHFFTFHIVQHPAREVFDAIVEGEFALTSRHIQPIQRTAVSRRFRFLWHSESPVVRAVADLAR